jgi:hypothetical protein
MYDPTYYDQKAQFFYGHKTILNSAFIYPSIPTLSINTVVFSESALASVWVLIWIVCEVCIGNLKGLWAVGTHRNTPELPLINKVRGGRVIVH